MRKKAAKRAALKDAAAERLAQVREKLIATTENWYPSIDGKVRVRLLLLSTDQWRVCVWGNDDFGMERDFPHVERQEAKVLFERITDGTTQAQMREWGLTNA